MVAFLLFMAVDGFYQPHLWAMRLQFPVWFKLFMCLAWLGGTYGEIRSWRAGQKSKNTPAQSL
jgi:hypothetical protein